MLPLVAFVCLVACAQGAPGPSRGLLGQAHEGPDQRIIGGEVVDIEQYPYQLSLEFSLMHSCGAAIISPTWAITAAHCTDGAYAFMLRLRAGSTKHSIGGSTHLVKHIKTHPNFSYRTYDNDVALLQVYTPFEYSASVQPIPLARNAPAEGATVTITGWGGLREGALLSPLKLRAVQVPVTNHDACREAYFTTKYVTDNMICAGLPGKDSCQGDSGGPVAANGELVGLVSWGIGCAREEYPGVNTNVAAVREWVLETAGISDDEN